MTHDALLGISVEPLAQIRQLTPAASTQASSQQTFVEFTQKMLENFSNYASSFAVDVTGINPSQTYIPASVLNQWFTTFQRRLQMNPDFWKSL